ncbi:GNAT family N-acetyltransferase [Maribacter sp. PR1]|uniref:GNAT family N-acetyltransferase n=1 Tax=Maribacter cobaltidurans TaxID=1178778 RepID=A0ABU7IZJ5_9FLAO|nr:MULTISPECIES: GNAT family N-acetyltransferase [Maribacter]MDC6391030.1 GNAT family N-acetyltransferase [Maribacter sp. PR1]MEE1978422.1 GNAT family N-acetyltransferase [Maribacter cobaltidurans]
MKLDFVPCQLSDLEHLISVSKMTFVHAFKEQNNPDDFNTYIDQAFSREQLHTELTNPNTEFYFVYLKGQLVAYFKLNQSDAQSDIRRNDSMELERIYVLKAFQGKQLGKKILDWVKSKVSKAHKSFLWLGVWEKNQRAIKFYERYGFYKFGTHPYFIGSDEQTDWLMRLDIKS